MLVQVLQDCNVVFNKTNLPQVYSACQLGKAHKLPFPTSQIVYSSSFELVVSDLWGPAHTTSDEYLYYISFVDVYNRYTWLYLLKNKSKALMCFVLFQKYVEAPFGCHIKMFLKSLGRRVPIFHKDVVLEWHSV